MCVNYAAKDLASEPLFHDLADLCLGLQFSFTIMSDCAATQMGKNRKISEAWR